MAKRAQPLWKTVWKFLKKLKRELPHDPATPLGSSKELKAGSQKDVGTPMFTAMLSTIPKRSIKSTEEWIRELRYASAMEYLSLAEE